MLSGWVRLTLVCSLLIHRTPLLPENICHVLLRQPTDIPQTSGGRAARLEMSSKSAQVHVGTGGLTPTFSSLSGAYIMACWEICTGVPTVCPSHFTPSRNVAGTAPASFFQPAWLLSCWS